MTHVGRYTNHGSGTDYGLVGSGTATAANGDQLSWTYPGSSWYVQWTGGTGRFQNVSGGWNIVSFTQTITYPDPDTVVVVQTYTGVGTITY
jgi:hypothetical protein